MGNLGLIPSTTDFNVFIRTSEQYYFHKYDFDCINCGLCYVAILLSYQHTSCPLLGPMTDEGRPNMKLFYKSYS